MTEMNSADNELPETQADTVATASDEAGRVQALESQLAEMKDKALRAMAETENIRRRAEREREDVGKYAVSKFAQNLLPVADNLRRAIESVPQDDRQKDLMVKLLEGVEATERALLQAFEKAGISPVETENQVFDANRHEVMVEIDYPDKTPGTIVQVFETGYMIADRLLRPARVGVAKNNQVRERINTTA